MKTILAFLLVLFSISGLVAMDCTVAIVFSINKSLPTSYTFKIDQQTEGAKYYWSFGDNRNSDMASPTHTFKTPGSYSVLVKVTRADGTICNGELKASFEGGTSTNTEAILTGKGKVKKSATSDGCALLITMENNTILAPAEVIPAFEFKDGQYVELKYELFKDIPSACEVGTPAKIYTITEISQTTECKLPVTFTKSTISPITYTFRTETQPEGSTYFWTFGDDAKSEAATPRHIYQNTGNYTVSLKVIDAAGKICTGEIKGTFDGGISADPAIFSGKGKVISKASISGCGLAISMENGNILIPVEWASAFQLKEGQNLELAYEFLKDRVIECSVGAAVKIHKIAVLAQPVVCNIPITYTPSSTSPVSYTFNTVAQSEGSVYFWYFGDEGKSNQESPSYTYKKTGTYVVNLKVIDKAGNSCYGEIKAAFEGIEAPVLAARGKVKKLTTAGCDLAIVLENGDTFIAAQMATYFIFNEGQYVEFTYEKLDPKVSACKEGTDIKIHTIKEISSLDGCKAYFTATNKTGSDLAMQKKVAFTNLSEGNLVECTWDFGDGKISKELKPTHEYATFGEYRVCLTTITASGCSSEYCSTVKVENTTNTPCSFDLVIKPKENASNTYLFYANSTAEIKNWTWIFGDGKASSLKNPEHAYDKAGIYEVSCFIATAAGCTETSTTKITVLGASAVTCKGAISLLLFDPTDNKCNGKATVKLLDETGKAISNVKYVWSDGRTGSTLENLCPDKPYTVQAIIEGMCQKNTSFTMLSKPIWKATTINGQNNFSVVSPVDGVEYEWNFGNGVVMKGAEVNFDFEADGIYNVNLKAVAGGDFAEFSQQVVVEKSIAGTDIITKSEPEVYPNPVKEMMKINFASPVEGNLLIEILNIGGIKEYAQQLNTEGFSQVSVNLQFLNPGIYFLRITNGRQLIADRKFIKVN
jgi:PKD repeat protein